MGRGAALIALATGILLGLGSPALTWSQDAAGAAYEGTQEAGGPVRLVVSADGARVVLFEAEGVAGGGCSWDTITLENWGGEIPVADNRFESSNVDGDLLHGAWLEEAGAARRIEGTIQVNDPVKGCQTPPLRWVATATS